MKEGVEHSSFVDSSTGIDGRAEGGLGPSPAIVCPCVQPSHGQVTRAGSSWAAARVDLARKPCRSAARQTQLLPVPLGEVVNGSQESKPGSKLIRENRRQ